MRRLVHDAGLERAVHVDSAGTHDYHVGEAPDARAQRAEVVAAASRISS